MRVTARTSAYACVLGAYQIKSSSAEWLRACVRARDACSHVCGNASFPRRKDACSHVRGCVRASKRRVLSRSWNWGLTRTTGAIWACRAWRNTQLRSWGGVHIPK